MLDPSPLPPLPSGEGKWAPVNGLSPIYRRLNRRPCTARCAGVRLLRPAASRAHDTQRTHFLQPARACPALRRRDRRRSRLRGAGRRVTGKRGSRPPRLPRQCALSAAAQGDARGRGDRGPGGPRRDAAAPDRVRKSACLFRAGVSAVQPAASGAAWRAPKRGRRQLGADRRRCRDRALRRDRARGGHRGGLRHRRRLLCRGGRRDRLGRRPDWSARAATFT